MTKGRTTTYDERVEIVRFCIEHQHNYAQTADKFQVSYQQAYSWTNKYLTSVWMHFRTDAGKENLRMRCPKWRN
ncbi:helix-turn-helix domain-containing protein [Paenibacillus larvae]|uniref:helix-turn-helix domain-containing protein n=1 Tax=Paenibacillus larvae TaxID=1464 RepID=UPI00288FBB86|nr:helix-turn-helix domain-containing protein [Paenibacillus larvae]MDT2192890.1 helix-turn-helix domain-containing protein [Paenibacillus larvae]